MRIVILAAAAALVGASAGAQEIGAWDTNSDGLLDEAEFTEGFLGASVFDRWVSRISTHETDRGTL